MWRNLPLPHQDIQPLLILPPFSYIPGDHRFNNGKFIERGKEFFESLFGHVGEISAVADALEGAVFEGGVEEAAFFERAGDVFEYLGEAGRRDVEDGGAGPDAVEFVRVIDVFEGPAEDGPAGESGGEFAELGRAVDGSDAVAFPEEMEAVAAGAAAEIQDGCAGRQAGQEERVELTKVGVQGVCRVGLGGLVVIFEGAVHGGSPLRGWGTIAVVSS